MTMIKIGGYEGRDYLGTRLTKHVTQKPDGLYVRVVTINEVRHPGRDNPFASEQLSAASLLQEVRQDIERITQASQAASGTVGEMATKTKLNMRIFAAIAFKMQLEELMQHGSATAIPAPTK